MALTLKELLEGQQRLIKTEMSSKQPNFKMQDIAKMASPLEGKAIESNLLKIFSELKKHTGLLQGSAKHLEKQDVAFDKEHQLETRRSMDVQTDILKQIEENTHPRKAIVVNQETKGHLAKTLAVAIAEETTLLGISKELTKHTKLLQDTVRVLTKRSDSSTKEDANEALRSEEERAKVLKNIEENTRPRKVAVDNKSKDSGGLGFIATAIAAALGGVIAAIETQLKTIKLFAKALTPEKWVAMIRKSVASFAAGLSMQFDLFKASIAEKIKKVTDVVVGVVDSVKTFFVNLFSGKGKIISTIKSIYSYISNFVTTLAEPFIDLFNSSKKAISIFDPIVDTVKDIFAVFKKFGSKVGMFAKIFGKLFLPLNVIMTIWDTVQGAIEGFEKDGIVGAISGAIKGLVNSLIMAPLDMLKDGVSWILESFGFDKAAEFLDSFSFEDLYSSFVDAIFSPIGTLKKLFDGAVSAIQNIEIPEISFTIPIIDKKVSIGPFHPFKSDSAAAPASPPAGPASSKTAIAPEAAAPASPPAGPASSKTAIAPEAAAEARPTSMSYAQAGAPMAPLAMRAKDPNIKIDKDLAAMDGETAALKKQADTTRADSLKPVAPMPTSAEAVYKQSGNNAEASAKFSQPAAPVVVSAPTTNVNNNQTSIMRIPSKNNDPTLQDYYRSRYAQ